MKRGKDRVTYYLPSLSLLNEKFIDGVDWPQDTDFLVFRLSKENAQKGVAVQDMVSKRKYICRTTYIGNKRDIAASPAAGRGFGLRLANFKSFAEYKKVYLKSHREGFVKAFKDYQNASYGKECRSYLKNEFPRTKGISVRKGARVVGMLSVLRIDKAKKPFAPLDWLTWLWLDGRLPREERRAAHGMLCSWIKQNVRKYYGAAIHAANLKSQGWMIKLGGRPAQIFFSRR